MNRKRKFSNDSDDETAPKIKHRVFDDDDDEAHMEEEHLSHILFGGTSNFLKSLEEAEQEAGVSHANSDSGVGEEDSSDDCKPIERKPAWVDEDDDGIDVGHALNMQRRTLPNGGINSRSNKYSDLLKHKFISVVGTPKWASLDKKPEASDSDDEILQSCGFIKKTSKVHLPSNIVEIKKVKDLNNETYSEGPFINSVEFHPSSSVGLVAGNRGIATLYVVDGKRNNKLHSVAFERFPIHCAKFTCDGNEAILGSRVNHIFSYDLIAAKANRIPLPPGLTQSKKFVMSPDSKFIAIASKWGEVYLLSASTKEKIALLKQDSEVTALSFNSHSTLLYGHSDTGEVTVWDMNMNRVKHKFTDEGCLQGTTITVSPSNRFIAAGSAQGVVNLYEVENVLQNKFPKPSKTILNLTTGITDLKFNHSSEILALCSSDVDNAVKLFHVGSSSVFSNFPSFSEKMGQINVVNFSPNDGFIAFGNKSKTVSLYRLKHYKNY